jgi:hypothetical protein
MHFLIDYVLCLMAFRLHDKENGINFRFYDCSISPIISCLTSSHSNNDDKMYDEQHYSNLKEMLYLILSLTHPLNRVEEKKEIIFGFIGIP